MKNGSKSYFWLLPLATLLMTATLITATSVFGQSNAGSPAVSATKPCDNGDSLAAIVCRQRAQKAAHAKKIFTDDNLELSAGPLPPLKMNGAENGDDIIAAIAAYKSTHTPEQTENAVHLWYDKYDEELAAAIRDNLDIKDLRAANVASGYELCQQSRNYRYCQNRQMAEARDAQHDQVETGANNNLILRIQHAFMNIRNGLARNNLRYDWFKIRTTNNVDEF